MSLFDSQMHRRRWLDWWQNGLGIGFRVRPVGIAIAIAYAFTIGFARHMSWDQFYLPAGVRIAALLVVPPRLWIYLLLGEYAYFGQLRRHMIDDYGLTWTLLGSGLLMPAVMVVVHLHRRIMAVSAAGWLISVAAVGAMVTTSLNLGMSFVLWPEPPPTGLQLSIVLFLVGDFVGALTVVPLALLWVRRKRDAGWKMRLHAPTVASLAAMISLGSLAMVMPVEAPLQKTGVLLLMALPAVVLTCLHGWRGAAISVPLCSLMIRFCFPAAETVESFDPATFSAHQSLALLGIALLAMGSTLSHYFQQYRSQDSQVRKTLSYSRSAQVASEMDLRQRALDIRKLGDGLDAALSELAEWLRLKGHDDLAKNLLQVSVVHSRKFREQVTMVYPTSLEHVGLYLALQIGGIGEAWKASNRLALHRLSGDPCQLSIGLQLATYRTLTEAVALLLEHECGQIQVRARAGVVGARRGILVSVGLLDAGQRLSAGTMALALERLTGRTLAYGGTVQCRRQRVRMLLVERRENAPCAAAA